MTDIRSLCFVFPVFNEEESLPRLQAELGAWMDAHADLQVRAILVDDGSVDRSREILRDWAARDRRIRAIGLSRNFGHQAAVTAGLEHADADVVVVMDADLQDPMAAVDLMLARAREGHDVVYGVRASRQGETLFKRASAWLYYRLLRWLTPGSIPVDAGDFRLMSRRVVKVLNALPERKRYVRGLCAWLGFSQVPVVYERDARRFGETKYSLAKMLNLAWTGISSFSVAPIRAVSLMGLTVAGLAAIYALYAVTQHVRGNTVPGWTAIVVIQTFLGGCILLAIGVVGEYVGRIFEEVKQRPVYLKELDTDEPA